MDKEFRPFTFYITVFYVLLVLFLLRDVGVTETLAMLKARTLKTFALVIAIYYLLALTRGTVQDTLTAHSYALKRLVDQAKGTQPFIAPLEPACLNFVPENPVASWYVAERAFAKKRHFILCKLALLKAPEPSTTENGLWKSVTYPRGLKCVLQQFLSAGDRLVPAPARVEECVWAVVLFNIIVVARSNQ